MVDEKRGIKEVLDVMELSKAATLILIKRLKDGLGMDDVSFMIGLANDEEFKMVLKQGLQDIKNVPAEIKDIDLNEGLQIATTLIASVPQFVLALKA